MSMLSRFAISGICLATALCAGTAGAAAPEPFIPLYLIGQAQANRTGQYGSALAVSGDFLAVGAPTIDIPGATPVINAGRVYIWNPASGPFNSGSVITAPSAWLQADMHFGAAVAMVGDRLLVGAPDEDIGAEVDAGAVYFYRRDANGFWQFDVRQESSIVQAGQRLGASVAITLNYAAAGAPGYNLGSQNPDTGRVQLFRSNSTDETYLIDGGLNIAAADDYALFGSSVHLQDFIFVGLADRLFVGAPNRTVNGLAITGAAYCYERSGGNWVLQDVIEPAIAVGDFFGSAVDAYGDYVFVGVRGRDKPSGGPAAAGAVMVYQRASDGTYSFHQQWFASDAQASAFFGSSLAVNSDGSRVVVGAPKHNGGATNSGRAYVFERQTQASLTFWTQTVPLGLGETEESGDELGSAVAITDDYIFAGAPQRTVNGYLGAGRVQVYGSEQIFADGFQ